jgi:hypothetical protein
MNVSESSDVNTLLRWLIGAKRFDDEEVSEADAKAAAVRLADRAYKTLFAGLAGRDVAERWPVYARSPAAQRQSLETP